MLHMCTQQYLIRWDEVRWYCPLSNVSLYTYQCRRSYPSDFDVLEHLLHVWNVNKLKADTHTSSRAFCAWIWMGREILRHTYGDFVCKSNTSSVLLRYSAKSDVLKHVFAVNDCFEKTQTHARVHVIGREREEEQKVDTSHHQNSSIREWVKSFFFVDFIVFNHTNQMRFFFLLFCVVVWERKSFNPDGTIYTPITIIFRCILYFSRI